MGSVNVNRNVSDQFYRYKMPRLVAKVEGKGNGIKTVIANMVDIAKSLNRPPTYPTKYFGCELGAQTQFDFKNDRFIVNGSHDAGKLQTLLDGFIKKFVLCPECENPETFLNVHQKKQTITQHCIACGFQAPIDMRHKLTTFILKNPPGGTRRIDQDPSSVGASLTTPKEKGKGKRSKGEKKKNGEDEGPNADGSDDAVHLDDGDDDGDDDDWAVDTSEDAVAQRMEALTDGAKGITLNDDLEKTQQERLDIFFEYIKKKKSDDKLDDREVLAEAERLDIKDKAILVLVEVLFDEKVIQQMKTFRVLFLRFCHENAKAQKYLLGGIEQLVNLYQATLLPKVAHILKAAYDNDILEEAVIIDWAEKASKKYVSKELAQDMRNKAAPFIKWLQEAEEDEESDSDASDDDDDVNVHFNDRAPHASTLTAAANKTTTKTAKPAEDDDLDIDAI